MTLRLAAALLCLLACASALAQAVPGQPLRLRYGPAEYGGPPGQQGLAITREGMLAVAASQDLLVYDGDTWAPVPMPGRQLAQSIARGHDGRIYAGAYDTFGVLEPMDGGGWSYRDLRDRAGLEGEARALGYIWQLLPVEDGLYVRADATLVFVPYDAAVPAKHWPIPLETRLMFDVGDGIVVRVDGLGLSRLEDGRFQRVPGGEHFADEPLVGVYVREHDWLLIGDDGFHSATPAGIRLLPTSASAFDDFDPYTSIELADGSLVIGGNGGELAHFGPDLAPRGLYPLGTGAVRALAIDHEGALWAGTERDLHRLRVPSPWTQLGASQGLRGQVFDMAWHRGQLYLGGSQGLARLRVDRGRVRTEALQAWFEMEAFVLAEGGDALLVGHRTGLAALDPDADAPRELLAEEEDVAELLLARERPDRGWAVGSRHLYAIALRDGRWEVQRRHSLRGATPIRALEFAPGELWLDNQRGGPERLRMDLETGEVLERTRFGAEQGLVLAEGFGSSLLALDGRLYALSGPNAMVLEGGRFIEQRPAPLGLLVHPDEAVLVSTPLGDWLHDSLVLLHRPPGERGWQQVPTGTGAGRGYTRIRYTADGLLRIATWEGVLQFDPAVASPARPPLSVRLARAVVRRPDGAPRPLPVGRPDAAYVLEPGESLSLRFGVVSLEPGLRFRYRFGGDEDGRWSSWTEDRELTVGRPPPGDFTIEIQAEGSDRPDIAPLLLRVQVRPAWWQRLEMRLALGLLGVALFALFTQMLVRRRTRRLVDRGKKLESKIAERTRELEDANRKLAELATEDGLTGIPNRRAFEQGLQREWLRCLDQRRALSVLMIDVDRFKQYNDTHGHLEGDAVLREVAQALEGFVDHQREMVARYGGEEFVVLLPGARPDEALARAERIRQRFSPANPVSVSIGVAHQVPSVQDDPLTLLRRADTALYRAKRNGRDRVEAATD